MVDGRKRWEGNVVRTCTYKNVYIYMYMYTYTCTCSMQLVYTVLTKCTCTCIQCTCTCTVYVHTCTLSGVCIISLIIRKSLTDLLNLTL